MTQIKNLLIEVCKTVVTDESMKKEFKTTLNLIEHQIQTEATKQVPIIINENDKEQYKSNEKSNLNETNKTKENEIGNTSDKRSSITKTKRCRPTSASSYTSEHKHLWQWGKLEIKNRKVESKFNE